MLLWNAFDYANIIELFSIVSAVKSHTHIITTISIISYNE